MDADRNDRDENEDGVGPDLNALERRLSAWRPSPGTLDRDRILYDAGRAAAKGLARPWRLATAAMLLASLGLGGALIHQRTSLERGRALLAQERALRMRLETALAARAEPSPPAPAPPGPIEPPAPGSYLALMARMAEGWDIATSTDGVSAHTPGRPAPDPSGGEIHPAPLRPQDIRRVLEL